MTELTGVPVTAVARINVVWLDTLRGFSAITVAAAIVHQRMFGDAPTTVGISRSKRSFPKIGDHTRAPLAT